MIRRWPIFLAIALALLLFSAWSFGLFDPLLGSKGVEPKGGDADHTVGYVALATSVVSMLTALAGLAKSIFEARKAASGSTK